MKYLIGLLAIILTIPAQTQPMKRDWLAIYYIPYDNNLSVHADTIIAQLQKVNNPAMAITVQLDRAGEGGMTRYLIHDGKTETFSYDFEKSDRYKSLHEYTEWVEKKVTGEKVAFFFLDHGGKLDETGLDEYGKKASGFLKMKKIAKAISQFNNHRGAMVDLIFLQVCAKASIEPLFELRNTSKYTLASQNLLGAPNFYYDALNYIGPLDGAPELSVSIANAERKDMYYSLSLVDNSKWPLLVSMFEKLSANYQMNIGSLPDIHTLSYWESNYIDLWSFISLSTIDKALLNSFEQVLEELLIYHFINPEDNRMEVYSGLSLLSPWDKAYESYFSDLEFFKVFRIKQLADKIKADSK